MVKAIIDIDENVNRVLNIVKAKENLRHKSAAINFIVESYGKDLLEPELRPEFIEEMKRIGKQKAIPFKNIEELRRLTGE
jgi:hypothetical protein